MTYKAVIFDLDGTLLNTLEDLADSLNQVLHDKGLPTHPTDAFRYFVGSGAAMLVSRALPPEKQNDKLVVECLESFKQVYSSNWNNKTRPYEGVSELLDALTAKNIKMAIFTNKPQHFADLCIGEFFSNHEFAMIIGQREGLPVKPDPAGSWEIAGSLDIPSEAFLYLGDSDIDMKTAVAANMFPVGALWGFRPEKELRQSGALKVIGQPMELLEFF